MSNVLEVIQPEIEEAYYAHMRMGYKSDREGFDKTSRMPLYPPYILSDAAGLGEHDRDDLLAYGPILRDNLDEFLSSFESKGVDIRPTLAATFLINLLTEDNLPYYAERNLSMASENEAMIRWVNEWIAEEDSHGTLMRDYALLTGIIGPDENRLITHDSYHLGRTKQLRTGTEIDPSNHFEAFHYLPLQELLTAKAHKMLSWMLDESGIKVISPIVGDEQGHYRFYRRGSEAIMQVDEFVDDSLIAMEKIYREFQMPGRRGIPRFRSMSIVVALSGIFDQLTIAESKKEIANKIGIDKLKPSTDEGKIAQEKIQMQISDEEVDSQRDYMDKLRDSEYEKTINSGDRLKKLIIGRTVDFEYTETIPKRRTSLKVA